MVVYSADAPDARENLPLGRIEGNEQPRGGSKYLDSGKACGLAHTFYRFFNPVYLCTTGEKHFSGCKDEINTGFHNICLHWNIRGLGLKPFSRNVLELVEKHLEGG
jgi:hypothetical protein